MPPPNPSRFESASKVMRTMENLSDDSEEEAFLNMKNDRLAERSSVPLNENYRTQTEVQGKRR